MEKWKMIKDFPNYSISSWGKVLNNKTGHILKANKIKGGYLQVQLFENRKRKMFLVHRLVALAFIENENSLTEVNHLDGNKLNNKICNLEWCSRKDNVRHAFATGLFDNRDNTGEKNGNAKLTNTQRDLIVKDNRTLKNIANDFGVTVQSIAYVKKTWRNII